jgi:hypothetical protein
MRLMRPWHDRLLVDAGAAFRHGVVRYFRLAGVSLRERQTSPPLTPHLHVERPALRHPKRADAVLCCAGSHM